MRSEMTKTGTFKGLWLCYTIGALAGLTAIGIVGPVGNEVMHKCRHGTAAASDMLCECTRFDPSLRPCVTAWARPIFGTLTDKLTPKNAAMLTYVLIIAACLLMYSNYYFYHLHT